MSSHSAHKDHPHVHGENCGHKVIFHNGHQDYLHDGHLHRPQNGHADECKISDDTKNPSRCTPKHNCNEHSDSHIHGLKCGHEMIPHGDHLDYLVGNHLHHPHGNHCDHHGTIE